MADLDARASATYLALLAAVLDATPDGVVVYANDGTVLACNDAILTLFGLDRGDAMPRARLEALFAEGQPPGSEDETLIRPDGRRYRRWTSPYRLDGKVVGEVVMVRDVSDAARRDLEIEQQREFLEKAQAVANIGSWVAELDGSDRLLWSPEMYRIAGRDDRALSRREAMSAIVHPDDREAVRRERDTALGAGPTFAIEHRILRPDGTVRWVQTRGELVRDDSGQPMRMVGTMQDVSERRHLEDELRQSRKLESLGRLAGGVAHDINNALTAVLGYAEQIGDAAADAACPQSIRQDLAEIQRAAGRGVAMTRQLLSFSRKEALAPQLFDLEAAVRSMERMLARTLGPTIELRTLIEPSTPSIYGDRAQIEQTIVNLAVNARDAMPDGGTLTLTIAVRTFAAETVVAPARAGRFVELAVTDTGHGMDSETRARIFEPFFTTKGPGRGTGLGLAMADATIKQSGGFIFVDSEAGKGTAVRVFFPLPLSREPAPPTAPVHHPSPSQPDSASRAATILLAEDEPSVLKLVATALRRDGHRVIEAIDAEAALAIADSGLETLDLLITDINMPGLSGVDLAAALIDRFPGLRVIVMTGFAPESVIATRLASTTTVLAKPFTPNQLRSKVLERLEGM